MFLENIYNALVNQNIMMTDRINYAFVCYFIIYLLACEEPCHLCSGSPYRCTECEVNSSNKRLDYAVNYACPCIVGYY